MSNAIDDHVEKCKFRSCTIEKELEFCCFCDEYPCTELHEFMNDKWPHHWTTESNLEFINKHGKQEWLKAQEREWSCKICGAEVKWYQKMCRCGQKLDAWEFPS